MIEIEKKRIHFQQLIIDGPCLHQTLAVKTNENWKLKKVNLAQLGQIYYSREVGNIEIEKIFLGVIE